MSEKHGSTNPFQDVEGANRKASVFQRLNLRLVGLALLISFQAFSWYKNQTRATETKAIEWTPCGENLECGRLNVPLDYANPDAGTASLSLVRYPATNKAARLGTLLTNPGGPGGSGVGFLLDGAGRALSAVVDGRYDIVSWDPRGVNGTTPRVECFDSETEQQLFFVNGPDEVIPATRNLSDAIDYAVYRSQVRIADSKNKGLAQLCEKRSGEALRHVGTATVVRDLERLFRTLEGDEEKVNYYGFSYGTIVGSYFVNMFPNRVGNVVIDGVVDPDLWANTHSSEWRKYWLVDTEKALGNFFRACVEAGPERCALTSHGLTVEDLSSSFERTLDKLYEIPLPVINAARPGVLTEGAVRAIVFWYLYRPREWSDLATMLSAVNKGNGGPIFDKMMSEIELDKTKLQETTMSNPAILCVDTPPFDGISTGAAFEFMMDEIVKAQTVTPHFSTLGVDICHYWRARETERFTGPFNHSLSNPILVIGNTADPVTPLANARAVKRYLGDSARLVIQDGSGHCSPAVASLCTIKAIRGYFLDNELPQDGLECPIDELLFPPASGSSFGIHSSSQQMTSKDHEILQKIRELGEALAQQSPML